MTSLRVGAQGQVDGRRALTHNVQMACSAGPPSLLHMLTDMLALGILLPVA